MGSNARKRERKEEEGKRCAELTVPLGEFWENGGICTFRLFSFFLSLSSFCLVTLHNQFITREVEGVGSQPFWLGRIKVFSHCQLSVFWCRKHLSTLAWPCFMDGASPLLPAIFSIWLSLSPLGSTWEPLWMCHSAFECSYFFFLATTQRRIWISLTRRDQHGNVKSCNLQASKMQCDGFWFI